MPNLSTVGATQTQGSVPNRKSDPIYAHLQLIVELQSSLGNAKEEAVRLKGATDQQLKEADAQWAEDRRKMSDKADQAIKVSAASHIYQMVRGDRGRSASMFLGVTVLLWCLSTHWEFSRTPKYTCVAFPINPTFNYGS